MIQVCLNCGYRRRSGCHKGAKLLKQCNKCYKMFNDDVLEQILKDFNEGRI